MKHIRCASKLKTAQVEEMKGSIEQWYVWLDRKVCKITPNKNKCFS